MRYTIARSGLALLAVVFVITSAVGPALASTADHSTGLAQQANTTTSTSTDEPTATECEPSGEEPNMAQARLYAPEKTITTGQAGQIAGGFQVDPAANCPVKVTITMTVPSGMRIVGTSDIMTGGAGMVSAEFIVQPGSDIRSIRANVFSENTGTRTVTADINMWPVGHSDMNREIDGLSFNFDVQEPHTPSQTDTATSTPQDTATQADAGGNGDSGNDGDSSDSSGIPGTPLELAIIALAVVGVAGAMGFYVIKVN